jgi:hypothetical protein
MSDNVGGSTPPLAEHAPVATYPPAPPQQYAPPPAQKGSGLAVAAMVLGIVAVVFCWIPFLNVLSIVLGVIALALGVPAMISALHGKRSGKGMAIAGVVLAVVAIIASIAVSAAATKAVDDAFSGTKVSTPDGAKDNGVHKFGETVTFKDGSTLKVEAPVTFKPAKFAVGGEASPAHVKYHATFTNNADKVFDPALTSGSVTSAGVEGDSVFQDGLDAPDNKVLPGKSVTWWMGYGVDDAADTQFTVSMGLLDYDDVIFTP